MLGAQGMLGAPDRRGGVPAMLARLGVVQLDTISVLARSHELVAYARLGPVARDVVEHAYWSGDAFEYWAHAACIVPIAHWPSFAFRRRAMRARGSRSRDLPATAYREVLARLRTDGPLTVGDLGGGRRSADWWDWSHAKRAVEWLLTIGDVVCVERRGWRRVYDLPERVIPAPLRDLEPSDEHCLAALVGTAARALGVATVADLAEYHRLTQGQVRGAVEAAGLVAVQVDGWGAPAWADPAALATPPRGRHRTTLLSPFDSLLFDRARAQRVFGFTHRLEAYVPRAQRIHGYFVMPLLAGGQLVGRVDPKREGATLVARQVSVDDATAIAPLAAALREAAAWVGCDDVVVERVEPATAAAPLRAALLH